MRNPLNDKFVRCAVYVLGGFLLGRALGGAPGAMVGYLAGYAKCLEEVGG